MRACPVCGASLEGRRRQTRYCGGACRAEASRRRARAPVEFVVPGEPAGKGSRTVGRRRDGSLYTRPAGRREQAWQEAAAWAMRTAAGGEGFGVEPVKVAATFHCERPARATHAHPSRGDLDKYARALLDALVIAAVIGDDRHVVELALSKRYGSPPRVEGRVVAAARETAQNRTHAAGGGRMIALTTQSAPAAR